MHHNRPFLVFILFISNCYIFYSIAVNLPFDEFTYYRKFGWSCFRFPNLVVGVITRDSVRQALRGGINADQIISYLTQHAHPQMLKTENKHPLPPTVVDQIKLWELERNRLTYTEGVLYSQFLSQVRIIFMIIIN